MQLNTLLTQIDMGSVALPEFQRGYVWNREQVRNLMASLYHNHPVGSLLVWETQTEQAQAQARGNGQLSAGTVKLLLDGQQRITSLYGIIRGKAPKFFEGNVATFTGLYFNLEEETFSFYMPTRMKDNPLWINVTDLLQGGVGVFIQPFAGDPTFAPKLPDYINRLTAIDSIKNREFHIEEVTGADKTVDEVVEIFNKVNSGGTKLSKGDLALARICADWPNGLQQGYSQPVALLINESDDTEAVANRAGFRFFTELDTFQAYVQNEILALEESETNTSEPELISSY